MEEKNFVGEQPVDIGVQSVATGIENGTENITGSPLGKFKNAETLLDAYNELQSEFTRKCQKLSEAEKKLQEKESETLPEKVDEEKNIEFAWNTKVNEFLQSHKNASDFANEITEEIMNDEEIKNSEDGLEKAYVRVLEKNFKSAEDFAKDEEFLENFIYKNDLIKNKIIKEYVDSLQVFKNPINIASSGVAGGVASSNRANSLEDAKKIVEGMFKF